ncbi:MAG: GNAT family N-acetyltransferase [Thermoanaerobaculia bacterium]|nr:GNAT family N-acetyltransferase [Thermoanaerobaculia bacterium]
MTAIRRLADDREGRLCAELMSTSEPWLTIGRTFDESLKLVQHPEREVYVAFDGETFRGFIILVVNGALLGYLQIIAVTPDARGTGIGSDLLTFAEERLFSQFKNVFLCVSSFNPRARDLYERRGYQAIGEIPDYLIAGHSELLMRKTIGPMVTRSA